MRRKQGIVLLTCASMAAALAGLTACNDDGAEYTVTFMNGDETVATATVEEGATAYPAAVSYAEGVRFDGWFAEGADTAFDFTAGITQNVTLYIRSTAEA